MIRTGFIGGSDIAVILGLSKYKSRLQLWLEKTGRIESGKAGQAAHWGNMLEPVVANEYASLHHEVDILPTEVFHHPEHDWARANLDRGIYGVDMFGEKELVGVLEIKTASVYLAKEWDDGRAPVAYVAQVQWYMFVTGVKYADIAVLIGGQEYREVRIHRNDAIIGKLFKAASEFWQSIANNEIPAPATAADAEIMHPNDNGGSVVADESVQAALTELNELKAEIKQLDEKKDALEGKIKVFIGDKSELVDSEGNKLATYKASKASVKVAWQKVAESLATAQPELFAQAKKEHTTQVEGSRRFLTK